MVKIWNKTFKMCSRLSYYSNNIYSDEFIKNFLCRVPLPINLSFNLVIATRVTVSCLVIWLTCVSLQALQESRHFQILPNCSSAWSKKHICTSFIMATVNHFCNTTQQKIVVNVVSSDHTGYRIICTSNAIASAGHSDFLKRSLNFIIKLLLNL